MRLDHVALWTADIERSKCFYITYFGAIPGTAYTNPSKGFESCFLRFEGGARLEIMKTTSLSLIQAGEGAQRMGFTHIAVSVGSESLVDELTERLRNEGYPILDGPRRTGDGYYESVTLDPDGNRVEITV